jgi:hypothetical protein
VVPPDSHGVPRAPCYSGVPLDAYFSFRIRGYHPLWPDFPDRSASLFQLEASTTPGRTPVWACPLSLAATDGIHVCFFSCRYLDVSVPCVRFAWLYIHQAIPLRVGFPIRTSSDQRSFASFPKLFAGCRVLHRLSIPRHPPYTLHSLTIFIERRRQRAVDSGDPAAPVRARAAIHPITGHNSPKRCSTTPVSSARPRLGGFPLRLGRASDPDVRCKPSVAENDGGSLTLRTSRIHLSKSFLLKWASPAFADSASLEFRFRPNAGEIAVGVRRPARSGSGRRKTHDEFVSRRYPFEPPHRQPWVFQWDAVTAANYGWGLAAKPSFLQTFVAVDSPQPRGENLMRFGRAVKACRTEFFSHLNRPPTTAAAALRRRFLSGSARRGL